jgi:hypothetical protein
MVDQDLRIKGFQDQHLIDSALIWIVIFSKPRTSSRFDVQLYNNERLGYQNGRGEVEMHATFGKI